MVARPGNGKDTGKRSTRICGGPKDQSLQPGASTEVPDSRGPAPPRPPPTPVWGSRQAQLPRACPGPVPCTLLSLQAPLPPELELGDLCLLYLSK